MEKWTKEGDITRPIDISDPSDKRIGFLSNSSPISFELDGKLWPTVEHYIQAKKFTGTQFEETLRKAPTIYVLRQLLREKSIILMQDGLLQRKKMHGPLNNNQESYEIRDDFESIKKIITEEAIRAKFKQYPRLLQRLKELGNIKIKDYSNKYTGIILKNIQNEKINIPNTIHSIKDDFNDLQTKIFTLEEEHLIKIIIKTSLRVMKIEGQIILYPDIIEDALYNLFNDTNYWENIKKDVIDWLNEKSWDQIYKKMINFEFLTRKVSNILNSFKTKKLEDFPIKTPSLIVSFIRWNRLYNKVTLKNIKEKKEIILPEIQRWYRMNIPKILPKRKKALPNKLTLLTLSNLETDIDRSSFYINFFKPHNLPFENYSAIVEKLEAMNENNRLDWLNNIIDMDIKKQKVEIDKLF